MTGLKVAGFSMAAAGLPLVGVLGGVKDDAATLANATPAFILAVIAIIFALAIVALVKHVIKTNDRHHSEWKSRETDLKEERQKRDDKFERLIEKNTEAITAMRAVAENCRERHQ